LDLSQKDKKNILHPFTHYSADKLNIPIVKGMAEFIYDQNNKEYIDAISSWWVNLHGHAHPYINERIKKQMDELEHVIFSGFTHQPAVELSEKILGLLKPYYSQLFYSDNGSTSVEVALKMAIQFWKNTGETRKKFLAFNNSYHGDTFGSMSVSERDIFTKPFHEHLFHVEYMEIPTENNLDRNMEIMEQLLKEENIAGFIFEPLVQAAGGMRMYLAEHLDFMLRLCKDYDVLTIADEVMTGFGRTGKMFAVDHLQNKPDFICLSKGLTGGYLPLGITAYSSRIADSFRSQDHAKTFYHGHSFTGNPISCSAAMASLELFDHEKTMEKIEWLHASHLDFADELDSHPMVENARVTGTILALDIKTDHSDYFYTNPLKEILGNYYLENGVLLRPLGNVVYVLPPYCISENSLKKVYLVIRESLDQLNRLTDA
jgi:adenosylmethionine---8-amino-7-oxononanoate aminotransferase